MDQFAVGLLCKLMLACGVTTPAPSTNPGVTIYQVNTHPAVTQLTYDQIANVGIDCGQRDRTIQVLENRVGTQPLMPESLPPDQRRLYAVTRSKIWQLRTYCQ